MRPINLVLIVITVFCYILNNTFFKKATDGDAQIFFVGYFNDLICPLFFVSYSNFLLITVKKEIGTLWHILLFCFLSGLVWEFFAPLIKDSSVTDLWDIVCYLVGGALYWIALRISQIRKKRE